MATLIPNMTTKTIVSDKGNEYIVPVVSAEEMEQIMFGMDSPGWCLTCGEEVDGVEPDARRYHCECCDKRTVYGMEELLMMGLLIIE
jgi:hypothetical protein